MPITRSYSNAFEVVDRTQELQLVPNSWTLLGDSGLFAEEMLTQHTVTFTEDKRTLGLITDQVRGGKNQANLNDYRKNHSYSMTHHPIVDALHPWDVQGKSAYGNLDQADTTAAAIARKMEKIKKSYAVTKEVARFLTLGTGNIWAPNGTIAGNFYTDFGITRKQVDFVLGTATTDIIAKCEEIIASFQDSAQDGSVITGVTAYCSPEFFSALISHAKTQASFAYQQQSAVNQDILRGRTGGSGLYRKFDFGGVKFVEVRTVLAGQKLITAKDAIFVADGVDDAFVTYYGPALRFGFENTVAMPEYMWTFQEPRGTEITIEAESNFINVLRKPNLVARAFTA